MEEPMSEIGLTPGQGIEFTPPARFYEGLAALGVVSDSGESVRAYLARHRDLVALLPAICAAARKAFAAPTELSLEMYRDPEVNDEYLTLYVRMPEYASD